MKKILLILLAATILTSCSNKQKEEQARQVAIKMVKDSLRLDSFKKAEVAKKQEEQRLAQIAEEKREKRTLLLSEQREATANNGVASSTPTVHKKKGWSDAAKGTLIGGVAGAVGGAIIDKKHGRGALIGGAAGAGAGYLIGRGKDKKSGRVQSN
ncbi:hypothetical protein DBR11_05375 [Pedobacter sp. HMWF019]|uniref:YMGG-like glycine zipper-containing protein n=1 Tax=Pedobacter sp. HMWF019 TaxID=2056856 RepID=UPI000D3D2078|nr:YMGG-like glycine zipper-containing protein [Pedobacter sp. HMWF019]PTT02138.1 hypothetical protein DBR11_05375 [Pedobacter sp. HMWF019]